MVRQTKRFKKGLNKKVLSAILAASMIMTSSSFAMAAPVEELDDTPVATQSLANAEVLEDNSSVDALADARYDESLFSIDTISDQEYNGEEQKPEITVKYNGTALEADDYTVEYENNVDVTDEAKVIVHFKGEYAACEDKEATFKITPFTLTNDNTTVVLDQVNNTFVYNGQEQYPAIQSVTVKLSDTKTVTLDTDDYFTDSVGGGDYQLDLVNAGAHRLVIEGQGNFQGRVQSDDYEIQQADLATGPATVKVDTIVYKNNLSYNDVKNAVTVTDTGLNEALDTYNFVVEFKDADGNWTREPSKDIGTHEMRVVITNDGTTASNFLTNSYVETTYEVVADGTLAMEAAKATVNGASLVDGAAVLTYNGKDQYVANDRIKLGTLVEGVDYKIVTTEAEWKNAGEYSIELEGLNKYAGQTATIPVKINPKSIVNSLGNLSGFTVEATQGTHPGSGKLSSVVVKVTNTDFDPDVVLQEGVDYTYEVKTENGKTVVEITGIGNYTTEYANGTSYTADVNVNQTELDLNDPSISVTVEGTYSYNNGAAVTLNVEDIIVTENDNGNVVTLKPQTNYEIKANSYSKNTVAGTASVVIVGKGGYTGERVVEFKIDGTSFADTFDLASIADVQIGSNVSAVENAVKVTYKSTGATYAASNYTVEILKDGEAVEGATFTSGGTYTVRVTPIAGRFEGTLETTFNVIGNNLKTAGAQIADIEDQVYTGEAITPAVVVTVGNKTLEEGKDYTVTYSDNIKGGEATVTVTGINDYSGSIEKNFNITRAAQSITMTNPLQERDLANGSRNSMSSVCTLKLGFGMEDEDLNLSYTTSDPSVATVNNGKITYQGVGECTITVTAKATDSCEEAVLPITVVVGNPGTPTFTPTVTSNTAKKAFVVTSSTVRGATGFEVQYSIRSDFWRATTKDFSNTGSKLLRQTCTTVHSNMTYYIRVRAYQVVDGEKVYSTSWSPVKTIKTK